MNFLRKLSFKRLTVSSLLLLFTVLYTGCGNENTNNSIIPRAIDNLSSTQNIDETIVIDKDDVYYMQLEKELNNELDVNRAPDKCAAQGLTKIVLNYTTDEIQTCSTYDLSRISATAYFSDKTDEVIAPAWSIYSGGGTLNGTIYTATNKPAIIVFKALYSENGISKLALFRLTVTGLISISLNKTTDEIQLPVTYDLSTELIITTKLSNGTTKVIGKDDPNLKWMLASGVGALVDGIYTPSAKVETATFTTNYTESGVTKTAQFKLKVAGLSSLILSKTTDEVNSCETYDLASKIIVSNKLSNGSITDITNSPNLTWVLSSGSGILDGKVYTTPAKAETAVFIASYTEAGITKTAQLRLKVTGLNSIALDKTTDEIMLPATYDLASEINAIAKFSDGESKSVDLIWALSSGAGSLSGSLYTPEAKPETAVFIGSYTEAGITKTAQFKLKVIGLSSLKLSKTTDEVVSCVTYDLSQIIVSDKLSNGTINDITNNTTWKLISGFGTLSGTTYTAPARAETAAFTANYTEAGIIKTAQFRLKVIALTLIKLSKATDEAQILALYDLASNIVVTAKLSNGQLKSISGNDPNLKWTLSYGSGILSGMIYTPPERIETAVLTATYTENGVAQSAQFRLKSMAVIRKNVELIGLTLNKTTDSVGVSQIYDLSKLIAVAKFADKTTSEVSLSWMVLSGSGSINGVVYTAPYNVATIKFMGTFTSNDGSTKSVYFILSVYNDPEVIDFKYALISMAGGTLALNDGVMLSISPDSTRETIEVLFQKLKDEALDRSCQSAYKINSTSKLSGTVSFPVSDTIKTDEDIYAGYKLSGEEPSYTKFVGIFNSDKYIINIDEIYNISNGNNAPNRQISKPNDNEKRILSEKKKDITSEDIMKAETPQKIIKMPFYFQYNGVCWAASWLMLLKGYLGDQLSPNYISIHSILHSMGVNEGYYVYINSLLEYMNFYEGINTRTNQLLGDNVIEKTFYLFQNAVIESAIQHYNGKPTCIKTPIHVVLGVGYLKNNGAINVLIHNPNRITLDNMYKTLTVDDLYPEESESKLRYLIGHFGYDVSYLESKTPISNKGDDNKILQTLHMPQYLVDNNTISTGIYGVKNNQVTCYCKWNYENNDGYSFYELSNNSLNLPDSEIDELPSIDSLYVKGMLVYNADFEDKELKLKITIKPSNGSQNIYESDSSIFNVPARIINANQGQITQFNDNNEWDLELDGRINHKINFDLVKKAMKTSDRKMYLLRAILIKNGNEISSFDIKFKYTLPKELTITSAPKHDFIGNNIQYATKYGDVDITSAAAWKVMNPDDNVITDGQGIFAGGLLKTTGEISTIKEYNILASYTDPNSHATSTQEVKLKLLPGIIPSKKTFVSNVGQSFQLVLGTEIMGDRSTSISWSMNGAPSTDIYSFVARENRKDQITARLVKGTMLQTGETLETDLYAHATMQVYNIYLESQTKLIDINEKCPFDLKWDAGPNNTVYFTNRAEWSCSNGTIEIIDNRAFYTPSKPGGDIITAKIAEGTFIHENSNDVISGNDLEFTAEVTVVEIKVLGETPITARIEPVDAAGNPVSNYRIEKEFSVSVDGATVPIELPSVDSNKGTIQLIETTDGNVLPVIHKFKFIPPPPMTTAPYYFTGDDTIHVNIKSPIFVKPSTSAEIVVYKPVFKHLHNFYDSGRKYHDGDFIVYTTGEQIQVHGYLEYWRDDATNSFWGNGHYDRNEPYGICIHYLEDGKLQDWYDFKSFTNASLTTYEYTYSYGTKITRTYFYTLTRGSIYVGWDYTYNGTFTESGWAPSGPNQQ